MSRTSFAVQEQLNKISGQKLSVSKISVPNTTVVNRAQINDLANDLGLRFGVERIPTQRIYQIPNEAGPASQPSWGVVGDVQDQIRFIGNWSATNTNDGTRISAGSNDDYVEITFYGTGLNMVTEIISGANDTRVSVDGGAEGANIYVNGSNLLIQRNYNTNQVVSVYSGLSLGIHTVKIRRASGILTFYGFEVLNESSVLNIRPGSILKAGQKFNLAAASTPAYNSGFESGTLGTRGGRVLTYLKPDGTIAKAVNPANASAAITTSADHTNEEVIRQYYWREFGANRTDDFSTLISAVTPSARAFTLEDGITSLAATSVTLFTATAPNDNFISVDNSGGTNFMTFTFVGTGLDLEIATDGSTRNAVIYIDGVLQTEISKTANTAIEVRKIVSGLPYGTHTVKILNDNTPVLFSLGIRSFIVYGPKKPTLPVGCVEVGEYYLMADYSYMTVFSSDSISQGVLQKASSRETVLVNTWLSISQNATAVSTGNAVTTQTVGAYAEFTFFGTGFNMRTYRDSNLATSSSILIDGVALNTTNFTISHNGGAATGSGPSVATRDNAIAFTPSTGVLNLNGATALGQGVMALTGLPLGKHTIRFTHGAGTNFVIGALDIITPVHMAKSMESALQNTYPIGSCAIGDLRETSVESYDKAKVKMALGIASSPTTTSTIFVPCPDMSTTYESEGEWVEVVFKMMISSSNNTNVHHQIYINGLAVGIEDNTQTANTSAQYGLVNTFITYLPKGFHKIDGYWATNAGTLTATGILRQLTVKRLGK
jgi:hypothetical protein